MASSSEAKKKRICLTIEQKLSILDALKENSASRVQIAKDHGCDPTTIGRIVKDEAAIREMALSNGNLKITRKRKSSYDDLNLAVSQWFHAKRAKGALISGPVIMEKASEMARLLNIEFQPSNGWLARWKANENVSFHKLHGEKEAADFAGAADWMEKVYPDMVKGYDSQDIFNADETGLYFKALPSGTMAVNGEKPSGGKVQKDRITILFLCNQEGSEKFVYSIGKSKSPRCFQRVRNLPVKYYSNSKAWMTSEIWTQILVELNQKLHSQKRKIILFIDNACCHKLKEGTRLQCINIVYLPPNATSLIQPLDQGIIHSFKAHYRHLIIRKQLAAIEQDISAKDFSKTVDVLQALHMVKSAWNLVTPQTISNCFRKAKFTSQSDEIDVQESEVVQEDQGSPNAEDLGISAEEFTELINCDQELECYGELTPQEIIANFCRGDKNDSHDQDGEVEETERQMPTNGEILNALNVLRVAVEMKGSNFERFYAFEQEIFDITRSNKKQSKITQFFSKN
uniref:HTH CENPB-type domain-containing protein n=1 Tax=Plectus sambesii TaxID=2011161 RepID=A0A914WT09_9BILA